MQRKLFILSLFLIVPLLAGCQTLGDRMDNRANNNAGQMEDKDGVMMEGDQMDGDAMMEDGGTNTGTNQAAYNNIFFSSTKYDPQGVNCGVVYWVHMTGDSQQTALERNVNLLLAGPSPKWQEMGYYSQIPEGTALISSTLSGGTVTLNFTEQLASAEGCTAQAARSQIVATARAAVEEHQGQNVEQVEILVDGQPWR